jgi:transposase-like protein
MADERTGRFGQSKCRTRHSFRRGVVTALDAPKYDKAVDRLIKDRETLLTSFDFPADHWDHLAPRTRSKASSQPSGVAPFE